MRNEDTLKFYYDELCKEQEKNKELIRALREVLEWADIECENSIDSETKSKVFSEARKLIKNENR